ncbi:unnamed protein product [Lactuca virosa]|uniref:Uncharacterized protein n=1 Tax=Lactuca virosa TaxID=75947 RepID=A0AAU9MA95_9ASTR|nr:unnamed protein product [Lactuca virosa]
MVRKRGLVELVMCRITCGYVRFYQHNSLPERYEILMISLKTRGSYLLNRFIKCSLSYGLKEDPACIYICCDVQMVISGCQVGCFAS